MSITPTAPAPTPMAGNMAAGQEAVALVTASLAAAAEAAPYENGEQDRAFTRVAVTCQSAQRVDAYAKEWGVRPRWSEGGAMYIARRLFGGSDSEAEAVYYSRNGAAE